MAQLEDPLWPPQVLESLRSKIPEADPFRQMVNNEVGGGLRAHNLATVCGVSQTGATVDGRADVFALVPELHLPGVQADTHGNRASL
jgi:hypothetical protein